ncbi:MAG TPA: HAD family phosphatase, partial [Candidatus Binatia bacterium]|nr:HAD family phosphatase [Candidatus Binatia bacterium]
MRRETPVVRAVLFDLDGLMVDSEPHSLASWRAVLSSRGVNLDRVVSERMFGLRQLEAARLLAEAYGLADRPSALAREKEEYQICHLAGRVAPMPGLYELLDEVERRGLRTAVASSGVRPYVSAVLQAVGLAGRFRAVVTGDDVVHGKPAPDVFLAAAQAVRTRPRYCLVLEDAPS